MRIALVQSAPRLGEFAHNCVRVEQLLAPLLRPHAPRVDLVVLPELALTGYAFPSRQAILPHCERLEPESGNCSWPKHARSLHFARGLSERMHRTPILLGVPEVAPQEEQERLYNSSALLCGDKLLHVYRKHHLFTTDETWAEAGLAFGTIQNPDVLEGRKIAIGIGFTAPWDAYEFARHCVAAEAEVVVVPMAWLRSESPSVDDANAAPRDELETLRYWLMRVAPVLELKDGKPRVFVACNRTGEEGETVYAGSSAVCRVTDGEIELLGHLSRDENLLVVDV